MEKASMARIKSILKKVSMYNCKGIIICMHRNAENEYTQKQADEGFEHNYKLIKNM